MSEGTKYVSVMIYMRFNQNIESWDGKVAIGHNIDMLLLKILYVYENPVCDQKWKFLFELTNICDIWLP